MLTIKNSLFLGIELFSLFLKNFLTNGLMFRDTVGIELSSTTHRTLNKCRRIIFDNVLFGLTVGLFDRFLLNLAFLWNIDVKGWNWLVVWLLFSEWWSSLCLGANILVILVSMLLIVLLFIGFRMLGFGFILISAGIKSADGLTIWIGIRGIIILIAIVVSPIHVSLLLLLVMIIVCSVSIVVIEWVFGY